MSYKDTEAKLKRVLDKLASLRSEFYTEKAVFEKRRTELENHANELLGKLNTGNWRFAAKSLNNSYFFAETRYLDDDVMCVNSPRYDALSAPIGFSLENARRSNNSEVIKQCIVASMLNCISRSTILRLDLFADTVLKPAELVEYKITSDMCGELYDMVDEVDSVSVELFDKWYESTTPNDIANIEGIVEQASQEWIEEGYLKVGMNIITPFGASKIVKIVNNPKTTITTEDGRDRSLHGSAMVDLIRTWKAYHPEFKVDELLYPMDDMKV